MVNGRRDFETAKTWATGHIVAAAAIAVVVGIVIGAILF